MRKNWMKKSLICEIIVLVIGVNAITSTSGNIGNNNPPNPPTITGPAKGTAHVNTYYNFTTIDPDGDNVYYIIDWGDNNTIFTNYMASGAKFILSHTWNTQGSYSIKAKAVDINGAESKWVTLKITMPCTILVNTPFIQFLQNIIQNHPNLFPILQKILQR
jgi:uncharacterized protein YceK